MNELSESEREEVIAAIRAGRTLPARYRASLFDDALETELIWPGKTSEVERTVLPFQSIEHIDEPRSGTVGQPDLFSLDTGSGRQAGGWTNKLIWGDNKLILSSLLNGPLRDEIDSAGGLKLVYIDPPFDVGADFSTSIDIGEESVTKSASVVEMRAYRDTWGRGRDSYASMIHERIRLIYELLAADGSIFVHCDWRVNSVIRLILDEVFGSENFRNEIIWRRAPNLGRQAASSQLGRVIDTIYVYSKTAGSEFPGVAPVRSSEVEYDKRGKPKGAKWDEDRGLYFTTAPRGDYTDESIERLRSEGRVYESSTGGLSIKYFLRTDGQGRWFKDQRVDTLWDDFEVRPLRHRPKSEFSNYETQKPEGLLERIVGWASSEGDLVADFFCGSGTTLATAEKLGRKWIGADLGRFAIHTSRKRLISVQRELASEGRSYRAFEILNLGSYERQYFSGINMSLSAEERVAESVQRSEQYLSLILSAYGAKRTEQFVEFHGTKNNAAVFIGPLDAPITQQDILRVVAGARAHRVTRVDVLGFEFEMGITPAMSDEAKEEGVTLTLRYIPNDVFDTRAIAKGQVKFFDVGYLEVKPKQAKDGSVSVELLDFGVFYAQEDADAIAAGLTGGKSKVVVDGGQVVRVSKDKTGIAKKEVLTESWQDWIDYWAVDFDFESQKEVVKIVEGQTLKDVWTGRYIFENEWQDFRKRDDRSLRLESDPHRYDIPGDYKIAVKVVDVFGNDTTKVVAVKVK